MRITIHLIIILISLLISDRKSFGQVINPSIPISADSIIKFRNEQANSYVGRKYNFDDLISIKSSIAKELLHKKIIFLHFWFASCEPCIREFIGLNKLYNQVKRDTNFQFISLTFENDEKIKEFKGKYNLKYKIVRVSNDDCDRLNLFGGYPLNILLNRNMIIDRVFLHADKTENEASVYINSEILQEIKRLLRNYKN